MARYGASEAQPGKIFAVILYYQWSGEEPIGIYKFFSHNERKRFVQKKTRKKKNLKKS